MCETASGMPWEDLVQTRVAVPLGMASLGFGFPPGPLIGHNEDGEPSQEASDPLWHSVALISETPHYDDKSNRRRLSKQRGSRTSSLAL